MNQKGKTEGEQECDGGHGLSLPLIACSLVRIKEFEVKPSRSILSKWAISVAGLPCEIVHIEEWFLSWT